MTEKRLSSLYEADGLGGEKTMRGEVIRELIEEISSTSSPLQPAMALSRTGGGSGIVGEIHLAH